MTEEEITFILIQTTLLSHKDEIHWIKLIIFDCKRSMWSFVYLEVQEYCWFAHMTIDQTFRLQYDD